MEKEDKKQPAEPKQSPKVKHAPATVNFLIAGLRRAAERRKEILAAPLASDKIQ